MVAIHSSSVELGLCSEVLLMTILFFYLAALLVIVINSKSSCFVVNWKGRQTM